MGIVFYCQSCGARFEVDGRMAGKRGRCRKCGQITQIPRAEQLASMTGMPAVAMAAGAATAAPAAVRRAAPRAKTDAPSISSWLKEAASQVGLMPLSMDQVISLRRPKPAPTPLDDADDSKPYVLATPDPRVGGGPGSAGAAAAGVLRLWRREVGVVQRIFRWLNESAYFVSVPFLVILLFGTAIKSRNLALFGATFVVLLNIGRIVAGVANLAVIPLRDGLNTRRMKKPLRRVIEPVVTIALVFLGFTFIPWLASENASNSTVAERLREGAEDLRSEMKGELSKTVDRAKALDLEKLGTRAKESLRTLGDGPAEGPGAATGRPAAPAIGEVIQDVGRRARQTVEEATKQP